MQEVGSDEALARLQAACSHQLPHAAVGEPGDRGIRVALLSTRPLTRIGQIRRFPGGVRAVQAKDEVFDDPATPGVDEAATGEMGRGALAATVEVDGVPVTVVTAHFKSKLINYAPQARRGRRLQVRPQTTRGSGCVTPATRSSGALARR